MSLQKILAEVQTVETEAGGFLDQISQSFLCRDTIISKLVEYSNIDDYRRAVVELDEKEYIRLWLLIGKQLLDLSTNKLKKLN